MAQHQDQADCGLEGGNAEPVTIGRFNRWVALAIRHHVEPMKILLKDTHDRTEDHIRHDELMNAKIQGGLKVLIWLVPVANVVLLLVLYLIFKSGHMI